MKRISAGLVLCGLALAPARAGQPSPKQAIQDLKSQDPAKQNQARQTLRAYRFQDISGEMAKFADDPNPDLRILMAQSIGELGGTEASRLLEKLFAREKDPRVRRALLVQLAGLLPNEQEAFSFFREPALSDPNDELRYLSLNQLSLLENSQNLKADLARVFRRALLKDGSRPNQVLAALSLKEMGEGGPELSAAVLDALGDSSPDIRRRAALLAGGETAPEAFSRIAAAAQDPDPEVRANLCRSLGEAHGGAALPILKSLWMDKEAAVRRSAFNALAGYPAADAGTDLLAQGLRDNDPAVRSQAVEALEKAGDASFIPQLQATADQDPDPTVRVLARKAAAALSAAKAPK